MPADHRCADRRRDVVVAGRDIRNERSKRVERRFVAHLTLFDDLHFDLVERDMARPFDHHLNVVLPGFLRQFAQRLQFRKLRGVAGIGNAAGAKSIAQREAHIVLLEDLADLVKVLVQQILAMILDHPLGQDRAPAAHDSGDAFRRQRHVLHQHARVDRHVIDALLGLLLNHFQHHIDVEVFHATHAREGFVDGHGADGHRRIRDDRLADFGDVAARGKIHHGVCAELHRVL